MVSKKWFSSSREDGNFDKSKMLSKSQKTNVSTVFWTVIAPCFWLTVDFFTRFCLYPTVAGHKTPFWGHSIYLYKFFYSVLEKIIVQGYKALGLQYFFTAGPDEVKAWTIQVIIIFAIFLKKYILFFYTEWKNMLIN